MEESKYPYTSGATGDSSKDCRYIADRATNIKVYGYEALDNRSPLIEVVKARVQKQPVSVGITANNKYIHSYASGVIDAEDCSQAVKDPTTGKNLNPINHAVLIVGYGTDEATGLDYWLIKNSWNTTWGDKGYVKIKIEDDVLYGICGVQCVPKYPKL